MAYFRADAHLIAQMVAKDCLRYSADNKASLLTVFEISAKQQSPFHIVVILFGDLAEDLSRQPLENSWFEIKGELKDKSPVFESYNFSSISIHANSIIPVPETSRSYLHCEVIGRITHDPEQVIKNQNFEFSRFSIAVNLLGKEKANFYNISVFKPSLMKEVAENFTKGNTVFVAGELTFFIKGENRSVHAAIKLDHILLFTKKLN